MPNLNDTYTVQEVSDLLGVSGRTVTRYCNDGLLTYYRIGNGRYYIDKESVKLMLSSIKKESTFSNPNYNLNKKGEQKND